MPEGPTPARVRAIEGMTTVVRERDHDRIAASPNQPIFSGDSLLVNDGRAEIQLPDGTLVWLQEGSRLEIRALGVESETGQPRNVLMVLQGTAELRSADAPESGDDSRVDTPESSIYVIGRGRFRFDAVDGRTTVTAWQGVAELSTDLGSVIVHAGERSQVDQGSAPDYPWGVDSVDKDDFDRWCEGRADAYVLEQEDAAEEYVEKVPVTVSPYVAELDHYGEWHLVTDYGWIWRPTIYQVGWRPYYSGYWSWYPGGWTWVSSEPWGWAPYHYGRWSWLTGFGWVWIPGGVYSGAWVSWAATPKFIGWCPLDYYDHPSFLRTSVDPMTTAQGGGGWNFLPLNRWGDRSLNRSIVRADHVPHLEGAVISRTLPRFRTSEIRVRPEVVRNSLVQSGATDPQLFASRGRASDSRIPFRISERREANLLRGAQRQPASASRPPDTSASAPPQVPFGRPRIVHGGSPNRLSQDPRWRPEGSRQSIPSDGPPLRAGDWSSKGRTLAPQGSSPSPEDPSRKVLGRILRDSPEQLRGNGRTAPMSTSGRSTVARPNRPVTIAQPSQSVADRTQIGPPAPHGRAIPPPKGKKPDKP